MDSLSRYKALLKQPTFSITEAEALAGNQKTAYALLERLIKTGFVVKIRNNIYSAVNPATDEVVASVYQIGCAVSTTAYLVNHTALSYYGLVEPMNHNIYIASDTRFRPFTYQGLCYYRVPSKTFLGVITCPKSEGVRVTDLERTLVDCFKDLEKSGGWEILLQALSKTKSLDEDKLVSYIKIYDSRILYQKAGFILSGYKDDLGLSDAFFHNCIDKIGKSIRYLSEDARESGTFLPKWGLVVPNKLLLTKRFSSQ